MKHPYESDERLMQEAARGVHDAFSLLMRRYANPILTFLRRMTQDHHRAEELFQEVFLAIWTSRTKYIYPRTVRPWVFGIAMNKCRQEFRKRGDPLVVADSYHADGALETGPPPDEGAIATENAALVETALLRLPLQQRMVVSLRLWNSLSYAEIAEIIGCGESTARSNMYHGLNAMRDYLEPRM
ncbi:RNA polymerase sigma factor [Blastopirellula sp. JC732]|uniref:RNA polymerase sigma factor n=1 Tax=Blastopirellula sediminis TaxID=2894196 RepID=A0A9X1MQG4_9BACT|nr:RNA polymerase sigma factor [Blastopirellula sediminis]MCC9606129.1 RNA polymerase sigma factor [Blastopirellula sediminis]MCC9630572.1 RNA polymerase sigma factor [Blastopirellula sediminis]